MAIIRQRYSYTVYPNSDLATFVSKHTHKPGSCSILGILQFLIITAILLIIYIMGSEELKEKMTGPAAIILPISFVFFFFIFPYLLPKIADRFRWAEKIALREAKKKGAFIKSVTDEDHITRQVAGENEWKCPACGRVNQNYVGTCGCGVTKAEASQPK